MTEPTFVTKSGSVPLTIRSFTDDDEADVLRLLTDSLGGGPAGNRSAEFFRWKHVDNPFGRSLMLVAEEAGRIVGLRAFMRWRFMAGSRSILGVRAVDTATHPDRQGLGIFSKLTRAALAQLRGSADLVFNTPNEKSLPGYLKMGWRPIGSVPVFVKVNRPIRFAKGARRMRGGDPVSSTRPSLDNVMSADRMLSGSLGIEQLLHDQDLDDRICTVRDIKYLRWRYGAAPLLDYRAIPLHSGSQLRGMAIFRVRNRGPLWEATVSEVIVRPHDRAAAAALLREICRCVAVDHLAWSAPPRWTVRRVRGRTMSLRAPGGMGLVANPLHDDISPDPFSMASWALTLGDLEVF